jgi:hypothetical protein
VDAHTFTKQAAKVQTNAVCWKAGGNCFLGQEMSADGGIHTMDDNNVRSVLRNTKRKLGGAIQNKRHGVVLLHENARPHTAASTRELLEHYN